MSKDKKDQPRTGNGYEGGQKPPKKSLWWIFLPSRKSK